MSSRGVNKDSYNGLSVLKSEMFDDSVKGRFWNKVDIKEASECWIWKACKNKKGYGSFSPGRRYREITGTKISHRFAYLFHFGTLDCDLLVCHSCDNPSCCNPHHLWQGTEKQNSEDMVLKGRSCAGVKQGQTQLTETDVLAIRSLDKTGRFQRKDIGEMFNISATGVFHIINYNTWKNVA